MESAPRGNLTAAFGPESGEIHLLYAEAPAVTHQTP